MHGYCWLLWFGNRAGTVTNVSVIDAGKAVRKRSKAKHVAEQNWEHFVVLLSGVVQLFALSAPAKTSQMAVTSASGETSFQVDS